MVRFMCGAEREYTEEGSVTILEIWLPSDYTSIGWLMELAISGRGFLICFSHFGSPGLSRRG